MELGQLGALMEANNRKYLRRFPASRITALGLHKFNNAWEKYRRQCSSYKNGSSIFTR